MKERKSRKQQKLANEIRRWSATANTNTKESIHSFTRKPYAVNSNNSLNAKNTKNK